MAKTKKTSPGEAAAPARRRGTKALDLQPVAWVKVPSPQGVKPGAPVEVVGEDPIATDTLDTVRCGLRTFILEDGDRRWVAERLLDEQRPRDNPYRIALTPVAPAIVRAKAERSNRIIKSGQQPGAQTVIYVHGIGNKPEQSVLRCQWDTALFGAEMGDRTRMAYWVNRMRYLRPVHAVCGQPDRTVTEDDEATTARILALADPGAPQDAEAREKEAVARTIAALAGTDAAAQASLEAIHARMAATAEAQPTERPPGRAGGVSARVIPLPEPARRLLAHVLTGALLPDVRDFLFDDRARERMVEAVLERMRGGGEPFVVIGHSLGSVIAYEALRRQPEAKVPLFLTLGSPLGLQEIQDHFTRDGGPLAVPECVGRWVNVADRLDPVAADARLANDFAANGKGVAVQDESAWWVNPDSPRHPHSATGYLMSAEARDALRDVVGNAFSQAVSESVVMRDVAAALERSDAQSEHDVLIQLVEERGDGVPRRLDDIAEQLEQKLRELAARLRPKGEPRFTPPDRMRRFVQARLIRTEIEALRTLSQELGVKQVWTNARKRALLNFSCATVQARTAQLGYAASGRGIGWAVLDSGINAGHPHFLHPGGDGKRNVVQAQWDCTQHGKPRQMQDRASKPGNIDENGHGTHVAAIIAGRADKVRLRGEEVSLTGIAPEASLYGFRVLDERGEGDDASIIKALDHIAAINEDASALVIHGINLSLGANFDPRIFGCGHTPLCQELRRLWRQGVLVCIAAGNEGYAELRAAGGTIGANMDLSIGDPANLEEAIAVGSVHKINPHTYGVSYFSSRGPTADGRRKPDLVAPGEKILSARHGAALGWKPGDAVTAADHYVEMSGTSMAAPHVSGVLAGFLSVRREFIGEPDRVKRILLDACTCLGREPNMQGAGLVNMVKMLVAT